MLLGTARIVSPLVVRIGRVVGKGKGPPVPSRGPEWESSGISHLSLLLLLNLINSSFYITDFYALCEWFGHYRVI